MRALSVEMTRITAEEYELLGFFEVEPKLLDKDSPWIYNDSVYEVIDGNRLMTVAIQPSYKDVRVILSEQGDKLFEFEAAGIKDVRVLNEKKHKFLEIVVSKSQSVLIKRKPHISIYIAANEDT